MYTNLLKERSRERLRGAKTPISVTANNNKLSIVILGAATTRMVAPATGSASTVPYPTLYGSSVKRKTGQRQCSSFQFVSEISVTSGEQTAKDTILETYTHPGLVSYSGKGAFYTNFSNIVSLV